MAKGVSAVPGRCKAAITTEWDKGRNYRRRVFDNIEGYWVDSAFDNDADQWEVTIGDPDGDLFALFKRDAEIRVSLFALGSSIEYLHTGFADECSYALTAGVWTLTGRDMSALATDSTAEPRVYRHVRAANLIGSQARHIGFNGTINLKKTPVYKREYTDGSETYWEFWYRMLRKDQLWLWAGSDGSLNSDDLNEEATPTYYFGIPPANASRDIQEKFIPVEEGDFTKNLRSRVHEVWVQGHKGDTGFVGKAIDPMTKHWIKKPLKIVDDATVQTQKAAVRHAWEEIFETKVGELEIKVTVPDPGFIIKKNRVARLRIPGSIDKQFFVVGTRMQAGPEGIMQEVRLREKQFAASRRVPEDPKLAYPPARNPANPIGVNLSTGNHQWGDWFMNAARKFSGAWDFNLFLACLMGICDQETSFRNVVEGGSSREWFDFKAHREYPDDPIVSHGMTFQQFKNWFQNENPTKGVGPFQLTTQGYKDWADDYFKPRFHDQWYGGRWHPQWNIMAGARAFASKLAHLPPKDENIWLGVKAYNGSGAAADRYMRSVKNKVLKDPGYLQQVEEAIQASNAARSQGADPPLKDQPVGSGPLGKTFPYNKNTRGFPGQGTHAYDGVWQDWNAVDIYCRKGSPVYAVHGGTLGRYGVLPNSGTVIRNPSDSGRFAGNRVNIIGDKGQESYYAHMMDLSTEIKVGGRQGMRIRAGQLIGYSGIANSTAHLHFAVKTGSPFHYIPGGDPRKY